ncbi:hypothetical protein BGZ65_011787, partial [Modicella reniformis]
MYVALSSYGAGSQGKLKPVSVVNEWVLRIRSVVTICPRSRDSSMLEYQNTIQYTVKSNQGRLRHKTPQLKRGAEHRAGRSAAVVHLLKAAQISTRNYEVQSINTDRDSKSRVSTDAPRVSLGGGIYDRQ